MFMQSAHKDSVKDDDFAQVKSVNGQEPDIEAREEGFRYEGGEGGGGDFSINQSVANSSVANPSAQQFEDTNQNNQENATDAQDQQVQDQDEVPTKDKKRKFKTEKEKKEEAFVAKDWKRYKDKKADIIKSNSKLDRLKKLLQEYKKDQQYGKDHDETKNIEKQIKEEEMGPHRKFPHELLKYENLIDMDKKIPHPVIKGFLEQNNIIAADLDSEEDQALKFDREQKDKEKEEMKKLDPGIQKLKEELIEILETDLKSLNKENQENTENNNDENEPKDSKNENEKTSQQYTKRGFSLRLDPEIYFEDDTKFVDLFDTKKFNLNITNFEYKPLEGLKNQFFSQEKTEEQKKQEKQNNEISIKKDSQLKKAKQIASQLRKQDEQRRTTIIMTPRNLIQKSTSDEDYHKMMDKNFKSMDEATPQIEDEDSDPFQPQKLDLNKRIRSTLSEMIVDKIEKLTQWIEVEYPKGNKLQKIQNELSVRKNNLKANKIKCNMCFQKGLEHHEVYYTDRNIKEELFQDKQDNDQEQNENKESWKSNNLCLLCALCTNMNEKGKANGYELEPIMSPTFIDDKLYRHQVNSSDDWICSASLKPFQDWISITEHAGDLGGKFEGCLSGVTTPTKGDYYVQGYESYQGNFHICLSCLLKYKQQKIDYKLKDREYDSNTKRMLTSDDKICISDQNKNFCQDYDPKYLIPNKTEEHEGEHAEEDHQQIHEDQVNRIIQKRIYPEACQNHKQGHLFSKNKPKKLYKILQKCYLDNQTKNNMSTYFVTIRGYKIKNEDLTSDNIQIEQNEISDEIDKVESDQVSLLPIDYFCVQRKYIHILETSEKSQNFLVVKTVETFIEEMDVKRSIIKTLRVFDPQNSFKLVDEIFLEQINVSSLKQVEQNHISFLQNGMKLYFFRRERKDKIFKLQLYAYDIEQRIKEKKKNPELSGISESFYPIEGLEIKESSDQNQKHVLFASFMDTHKKKNMKEEEFLMQQFILIQDYDLQEQENENDETISRSFSALDNIIQKTNNHPYSVFRLKIDDQQNKNLIENQDCSFEKIFQSEFKESSSPVYQFLIHVEHIKTPKQQWEKVNPTAKSDQIDCDKLDFIIMSDWCQTVDVQIRKKEQQQKVTFKQKPKIEQVEQKISIVQNKPYMDNINYAQEVQMKQISSTLYQPGKQFNQYYLITQENAEIILVYPLHKEKDVQEDIIKQIKLKLGNDYQQGGKKVIIQRNIKRNQHNLNQINWVGEINKSFYKNVRKTIQEEVESHYGKHKHQHVRHIDTEIKFKEGMFTTFMYIHKMKQDPIEEEQNNQIQIIAFRQPYSETFGTLDSLPVSDRLIIRNLFEQNKDKTYLDKKLYLNAFYRGVISRDDRIDSNVTQLIYEHSGHCTHQHSYSQQHVQCCSETYAAQAYNSWINKAQEGVVDKQLKDKYVYVEGVRDNNLAQDEKEIELQQSGTTIEKLVQEQERKKKEALANQQVVEINYWYLKLSLDSTIHNLDMIQYVRSQKYYLFMMLFNKTVFFVRKKFNEVNLLDLGQSYRQCLLYNGTNIYVLTKPDEVTKVKYQQLKSQKMLQVETIQVRTEDIVDNKSPLEFMPFLSLDIESENKGKYTVQSVALNIFDIENMQILQSLCCSPPLRDLPSLYKGYKSFSLCRISDTQTIQVINKNDIRFKKGAMKQQSLKIKYAVTMWFPDQYGRFLVKEFSIAHILKKKMIQIQKECTEVYSDIKLYGQKEIQVSHYEDKLSKIMQFKTIPFINNQDKLKGFRLIFHKQPTENEDEDQRPQIYNSEYQVINLLNDEYNNVLRYKSKYLQFGHQLFYNIDASAKNNLRCYYLVLSAAMDEDYIENKSLVPSETMILLKKYIRQMYGMMKFNFIRQMCTSLDMFKRLYFFMPQEILYGQCLTDIYISDEKTMQEQLSKSSIEQIECSKGSNLHREIEFHEKKYHKFEKMRLLRANLCVSFDFDLVSQIERAINLNEYQTINGIFLKVFEHNSPDYAPIIMHILKEIVKMDQFQVLLPFFGRDEQEIQTGKACNLEQFFDNYDLPGKTDKKRQSFSQSEFKDGNHFKNEITVTIRDRINKLQDKENIELTIPAEHSFVDFQCYIIGQKLSDENNSENRFLFDDLRLAELMVQFKSSPEFYEEETIQKIIDHQFQKTKNFYSKQQFLYIIFFLIPLIMIMCSTNMIMIRTCYIICYFTQLLFFGIELLQLKQEGWRYLKDRYNISDMLQFIIFFILFFLQFYHPFTMDDDLLRIILKMILVLQAFVKLLFFMRLWDNAGFLVQMVVLSLLDLRPFFMFFSLWVIFFTVETKILHVDYQEEDLQEYEGLPEFAQMILIQFRNSIGDVIVPSYDQWLDKQGVTSSFVIGTLWFMWLANVIFILVMLLNFLIAVISQTYERVSGQAANLLYIDRAELNREARAIMSTLYHQDEVKMIVFSYDKSTYAIGNTSWQGVAHSVKMVVKKNTKTIINTVREMVDDLKTKINKQNESVETIVNRFNKVDEKLEKFHIIEDKMEQMHQFMIMTTPEDTLNENQKERMQRLASSKKQARATVTQIQSQIKDIITNKVEVIQKQSSKVTNKSPIRDFQFDDELLGAVQVGVTDEHEVLGGMMNDIQDKYDQMGLPDFKVTTISAEKEEIAAAKQKYEDEAEFAKQQLENEKAQVEMLKEEHKIAEADRQKYISEAEAAKKKLEEEKAEVEKLKEEHEKAESSRKQFESEAEAARSKLEQEIAEIDKLKKQQQDAESAREKYEQEAIATKLRLQFEEAETAKSMQEQEAEAAKKKLEQEEAEAARQKYESEAEATQKKLEEEKAKVKQLMKDQEEAESARLKYETDAEAAKKKLENEKAEVDRLKQEQQEAESTRQQYESEAEAAKTKLDQEKVQMDRLKKQQEEAESARQNYESETKATQKKLEEDQAEMERLKKAQVIAIAAKLKYQVEVQTAKLKLEQEQAETNRLKQEQEQVEAARLKLQKEEAEAINQQEKAEVVEKVQLGAETNIDEDQPDAEVIQPKKTKEEQKEEDSQKQDNDQPVEESKEEQPTQATDEVQAEKEDEADGGDQDEQAATGQDQGNQKKKKNKKKKKGNQDN